MADYRKILRSNGLFCGTRDEDSLISRFSFDLDPSHELVSRSSTTTTQHQANCQPADIQNPANEIRRRKRKGKKIFVGQFLTPVFTYCFDRGEDVLSPLKKLSCKQIYFYTILISENIMIKNKCCFHTCHNKIYCNKKIDGHSIC
ncbi:hypothetical protein NC652_013455 [Populus alba x Populus x berolinensis]|nr:hypothetical protein NC652_013455 [Populus alba x Populus x berolinensis]